MKKESMQDAISEDNEKVITLEKEDQPTGIYKALSNVMADISAIGKDNDNKDQHYKYRGIDQLYNALQPALTKNGVIVIPNLLEMTQEDRVTKSGAKSIHTVVKVEFTFMAGDGSFIKSVFPGENIDFSDKSINKAMTSAYKYCLFETLCIPTEDMADADSESPEAGETSDEIVPTQNMQGKLVTKTQIQQLEAKCKKADLPIDFVTGLYGKEKLADLTQVEGTAVYNNFDRFVSKYEDAKRAKEQEDSDVSFDIDKELEGSENQINIADL